MRFTKNDPTFLRFLKLVTDEEGRSEAFKTFVQRYLVLLCTARHLSLSFSVARPALWLKKPCILPRKNF